MSTNNDPSPSNANLHPAADIDLARVKRDAKTLKKAVHAGDSAAQDRVSSVITLRKPFPHADALHVLALEHGYPSWPALALAVEAAHKTILEKQDWLERALYFGHGHAVKQLLQDNPNLAANDLGLRIALYDVRFVRAALEADPAAATSPVRQRMPIAHLCFSQYASLDASLSEDERAAREAASAEVASLLVSQGADVNESVAAEQTSPHRLSMLYGALGHARNLGLARWLLEHGANPNDNESLYHATERVGSEAVELLLDHGAEIAGTNAILRAVNVRNQDALRALLDAGGDQNGIAAEHPSGEPIDAITPLQLAALEDAPRNIVETLLDAGANPHLSWHGRNAFETASISGAKMMVSVLRERGLQTPLSAVDTVLAACAEGAMPASPLPVGDLPIEDWRLLVRVAALPGRARHLRALLAAGFQPQQTDEMGMTALHMALWEGLDENVAVLLEHDPDFEHRNEYGGDAMATLLHGAEFCPSAADRAHVACARLLLAAGVPLPSERALSECGNAELVAFFEEMAA